jgi:isoquinoline 1-oxidoreductase beta subunit
MNLEAAKKIDRRRFITYLVAAPTLTFVTRFPGSPGKAEAAASADGNFVHVILEVTPDNKIIMQVEREEMGQGIATAFAMLVAEELDAKLDDIDVRLAATGFVGGSNSIRSGWSPVRSTAATARAYLVTAAAWIWNVDATTLTTPGNTTVFDPSFPGGRSLTYGQLTSTAATLQSTSIPSGVRSTPKAYVNHTVIGKPTTQLGIRDIVTGKTQFTMDVQPNALPTVVARPPTINAPPTVDTAGIAMMDGVVAVTTIPTGVAITATTFHHALKAKEALESNGIWAPGPMTPWSDSQVRTALAALAPEEPPPIIATGQYVEGRFQFNFVSHSPMEVFDAVADVRSNGADIWTGTQSPGTVRSAVAQALGFTSPSSVVVHQMRAGSSFGSRSWPMAEVEAARISKAIGAPVKLMWTRVDTVKHGWTRPAACHQIRASLAEGITWYHYVASIDLNIPGGDFPSVGFNLPAVVFYLNDLPYRVARNIGTSSSMALPMHNGVWRSVHSAPIATARELMVDELAALANEDPVQFRRRLVRTSARGQAVLDIVARAGKWGRQMRRGTAQGVGYHEEFPYNSSNPPCCVAALAEVDATDPQNPRVTKMVMAADVVRPVNPKGVEAQLMGAAENGIATVLQSGLHLENGAFKEGSFGAFNWTRQRHNPKVWDIHVVPAQATGEPGGVGELGISPAAGAVANAYARATGTKPRNFPIVNF